MESGFKMRISRMFRSSFGSCRPRNVCDIVEKPVFVVQDDQKCKEIQPCLNPKVRIFPSMCRPSLEDPFKRVGNDTKEAFRRRKVSDRGVYFVSGKAEGRTCPPASPISPLSFSVSKFQDFHLKNPRRTRSKKSKKTREKKNKDKYRLSSSSGETNNGWFSSEEEEVQTEDETETFFSSRSFSSDSSESKNKNSVRRRRNVRRRNSEMGITPLVDKVEESFAVVKRSRDPYNDFRTSMVEMIVEKQIFSAKDLEKLLHCFLSLNSSFHHGVIVEVFTEIWEALFT